MVRIARGVATFFVAWLLLAPATAHSQVLAVDGKVKTPLHLTLDALKKMPADQADAVYTTDRGPASAHYTGVRLWALIGAAGGIADPARGAVVRHTIRITASDGYIVVLSTGEIAPDLGGKAALVAYEQDGNPLADFRLVVPGDKVGDRNVHDVVRITVE